MPSIQVNSTNIQTFSFAVTFNIYQQTIIFDASATTYNGGGISAVRGIAFSLVDQQGVTLLTNTFPTTQIPTPNTGQTYSFDTSSLGFAFLFTGYQIIGSIQEANGTIYSTPVVSVNLCMPPNFNDSGYVPGQFVLQADCINDILEVSETTAFVYNNLAPVNAPVSTGVLNYPTGSISPLTFTGTPFTNDVIYTGWYNITCTTIATYDISNGNGIYVAVSYVTNSQFQITCGNFLGDVSCCLQNLYSIYFKNCNNATGKNALQQYNSVAPLVMNGLIKQINGQDASWEANQIKKQLNCDCGSNAIGQNQVTPTNPSVYNIVINGVGGTTVAPPTITGNTKTFNIVSNTYLVTKGNGSDLAYTITATTNPVTHQVQYAIAFNYDVMAQSIYTATANDPVTLAQFNALIQQAVNSVLGLNGACVINMSQITYTLSQNITLSTGITSINANAVSFAAPTGLLAVNAASVATWLNSLGLGVFNVTVFGGVFTVVSVNNSNSIATMTFTTPNVTLPFQATNKTLLQVLQAIINWMCEQTDLQLALNNVLSLCFIDYNGNGYSITYPAGTSQNQFNLGLQSAICSLQARLVSVTGITCETLENIFASSPNSVFNVTSDWLMASVGGACLQLTARQAALAIIGAINSYSDVKNAYCAIDCASPVSCPDIENSSLGALSQSSVGVYGVTFTATPSGGQVATVKYRVTGTSTYSIATSNLNLLPNGNVSVSPPFVITGLTAATQYDIFIQNNCGGTGFVKQITTPAASLYSGQFLLDNSIYAICGDAAVTLYSAVPFTSGTQMFSNSGLTVPVTGYLYIAATSNGAIYQLNPANGVVGANTFTTCASGTPASYMIGNSTGTICAGSPITLYTSGAFAVGGTLYLDSALSSPVTGNSYVVQLSTNTIYNLNNATGVIGTSTGLQCSTYTVNITSTMAGVNLTAVTGITGFTPSPALPLAPGGTVVGTHSGFTGAITLSFSGTLVINPSNVVLTKNGTTLACITMTNLSNVTFPSFSYLSTDVIGIQLNTSLCP